jgi:hypothetical protein
MVLVNKKRKLTIIISVFIAPVVAWVAAEIILTVYSPPTPAAAHSGEVFGPACGKAVLDGEVSTAEWSSASTQTFTMQSGDLLKQFNATLSVMNGANKLYLGFSIEDDEFSTIGQYLPLGDGFRIDFDNDHGGILFTLEDEVLGTYADLPQFQDAFIIGTPVPGSSMEDADIGGTTDGASTASRVGDENHFELEHPLCSGDSLDFCLQAGETVGFRLEYFDAEANMDFGGNYFYPGSSNTSEADIIIGDCNIPDLDAYLPIIIN